MINPTQFQILERELNADFMKLLKSAIEEGWLATTTTAGKKYEQKEKHFRASTAVQS